MGLLIDIRRLVARRADTADPGEEPPLPRRLDDDEGAFARLIAQVLDGLPEEFARTLDHVPVLVSDAGAAHGAYGLYQGAGVARDDVAARIVVFRDTLSRDFGFDRGRLAEEIRRTVLHELAHHLGYHERGVASLGL